MQDPAFLQAKRRKFQINHHIKEINMDILKEILILSRN